MPSFNELIQQGVESAWFFIPTAVVLGALHGLEPGHSKTMMAAFIIAVRGTIAQAVLLGLSAAISHSLIIWVLAALALHFGSQWNAESTEPYFQLVSGIIIIALAVWIFWRTNRNMATETAQMHDHHHHDGPHGGEWIKTGHGFIEVCVFEDNAPPRFRLHFYNTGKTPVAPPDSHGIVLEAIRRNGERQRFAFSHKDEYLEADTELPEPHEFEAVLTIPHGEERGDYEFALEEHHHHHGGLNVSDESFQDAHERAHAEDIARRFTSRHVTTGQIVLFGLTGGLLPCPAALTILLVCLQLKQFTLGFTLVLSFSVGLALTMVSIGTAAAWSVQHASHRIKGFGKLVRYAPYLSGALLVSLGLYIGFQGLAHLVR